MTIVVYVGNGVSVGLIQPTKAMLAVVFPADSEIVEASGVACSLTSEGLMFQPKERQSDPDAKTLLKSGDLIVVPGGNAFDQYKCLSHVIKFLKDHPGLGVNYFGICAGAILWQMCNPGIVFISLYLDILNTPPLLIDVGGAKAFAKNSPGFYLDKSASEYKSVSKMPDSWKEGVKTSYALLVGKDVLLSGPHFEMAFWNKEVASSEVINMLSGLDMKKVTSLENQERIRGLLAQRMAEAGFKVKTAPVAADEGASELQGGGAAVAVPTPVSAFSL